MKKTAPIPIDDVNARLEPIAGEVKSALQRVANRGELLPGREVAAFEQQAADYCGVKHAITCASGADALLSALIVSEVDAGLGIITSPFADITVGHVAGRLSANPVLIDIQPFTYHMEAASAEAFLQDSHPLNEMLQLKGHMVEAIITEHKFGHMDDMSPYLYYAEEYDVTIIEGGGHSLGARRGGKKAGSIGDMGCFSLFDNSSITGYGEAGLITTDRDEIAERLRSIRRDDNDMPHLFNKKSYITEAQAAVLQVKLKHWEEWIEERIANAHYYNRLFEQAGISGDYAIIEEQAKVDEFALNGAGLKNHRDKIFTPNHGLRDAGDRHTYSGYIIRTGARRELAYALEKNGIRYGINRSQHEDFLYYLTWGYNQTDCPCTSRCASTTMLLPNYPGLTKQQQERIVGVIEDTVKEF